MKGPKVRGLVGHGLPILGPPRPAQEASEGARVGCATAERERHLRSPWPPAILRPRVREERAPERVRLARGEHDLGIT